MHELIKLAAQYLIVVPVIALCAIFLGFDNEQKKNFLVFASIAAILTIVLVKLATALHQDPRPFIRDGITPYFKSSQDNGFPSDHAALSALVAFIVMRYRRSLGFALLLITVVIGTSRVVAGIHHTQDVAAGILIAAVAAACALQIQKVVAPTNKS